jgi:hypothetical protein
VEGREEMKTKILGYSWERVVSGEMTVEEWRARSMDVLELDVSETSDD